ncbi:nucleic acid-binding protein [Setomelanomma holmii]|uniref:Nucleic acid-binding protein n=1 Tax=Setomelanomma holmii TaxID=210430 RepID=A0A9P4HEA2_9PLEO|nr:nucleic acid-binding protein [Setomelanomma holmii]
MPRPKRNLLATIDATVTPPSTLLPSHVIARITTAAGNNLYNAELPGGKPVLAELEAKFRSTVWIKRGSFVVVDTSALADRENKLDGEIVNVVRDEKAWRKMAYWPKEFIKKSAYVEDSDEEESTVGKMPPADSDED